MNRKELLQAAWVSITKRLPPGTDEDLLTWNWFTGRVIVIKGFFARMAAEKELDGRGDTLGVDSRISHWMKFPGPHGETQTEAARIWEGRERRKRGIK